MKLKGDFVTNSSSAAFIYYGWKLNDEQIEMFNSDFYNEFNSFLKKNELTEIDFFEKGDDVIVGKQVVCVDNGEVQTLQIDELNKFKDSEELKKLQTLLDISSSPELIILGACMY